MSCQGHKTSLCVRDAPDTLGSRSGLPGSVAWQLSLYRVAPSMSDQTNRSRREPHKSIDELIADLESRLRTARLAKEMLDFGSAPAQIATALGLGPSPKVVRPWAVRSGTLAALVVEMLREAGDLGMAESEIVSALKGRHKATKDPRRAVHWTLYNLRRRSSALERSEDGRWRITGDLPVRNASS